MKIILLVLLTFNAYAARENTIDADCVRLKGGTCIDKNELGYSDGVTSAIQTQFTGKVSTTGNESISGVKTLTGQLIANSTANGFRPCPVMNETQRNAIASPISGDCLYNSTTTTLNVYNGSAWKSAGGGINNWLTSTSYQVDDVVIQSNLIYKCLIAHTSGTFATDLAAVRWVRLSTDVSGASGTLPVANGGTNSTTALSGSSIAISNGSALVQGAAGTTTTLLHGNASGAPTYSAASLTTDVSGVLPLANGGTNKNATASNGAIAYTDTDSFELLAPGTSGQILQTNGVAAPTFVNKSISGKAQNTTAVVMEEFQTLNNLLTETATGKYLSESGNTNILVNPNFAHTSYLTGWDTTSDTSTKTVESTIVISGLKSAKFVASSQVISLKQSSTLYAGAFADGVQGLATCRIDSNVALKMCSINAGTVSTTNCVDVNTDQKWGLYKIPFILGATSNGVSIASSGSVTGTVYVDDCFVGAVDLKVDIDASKIAGESYFAGTALCAPARTSTTVGAFTASSTCTGPTIVSSTMGIFEVTDSDLIRQTVTNLPAGRYEAMFVVPVTSSTGFGVLAINDGTTTCEAVPVNATTSTMNQTVVCSFIYTSAGTRVFELYGASTSGNVTIQNGLTTTPRASTKFTLKYFGSSSVYTASCGANCVDTFSAKVSSTGVVSAENSDFINGNCVVSDTSLYTCTFNTNIFTVSPNCTLTPGNTSTDSSSAIIGNSVLPTTTTLVARGWDPSGASTGTRLAQSFTIDCKKTGADFVATRNIIGSFLEVVTSPGISRPKTCYYAFGGAAATLSSPTECTTGTCVEVVDTCGTGTPPAWFTTSFYDAPTWAAGTWANSSYIKCDCVAYDTTNGTIRACTGYKEASEQTWQTDSSGGYKVSIKTTDGSTTQGTAYVQVSCTGSAP